jgi:hypothetical protein
MHKAYDLTNKERLSEHDDRETSVIRWVLADDEEFQAKARKVAATEPLQRGFLAEQLAKSYVANRGPHQGLIVDLLLFFAAEPWNAIHPAARSTFVHQTRAVWADAPLEDLDGSRVRERSTTLEQGARRLARRGAGRCIACGNRLAKDQFQARGQPQHCSPCLDKIPRRVRNSQLSEIREALDAGTGQRGRRRAARRAVN